MRKPTLISLLISLLLLLATIISVRVFDDVFAATDVEAPEFYFTRLVYSQNQFGFFGGGSARPSRQFTCPELGGGAYFPPPGRGWATDYPSADCKLMWGIHRITNLRVHPHPNVISAMDPDLFQYPYLYVVSAGGMFLSPEEAARLREYLLRGGFLHVDDFWGLRQFGNFANQMRKVFPDRPLTRLSLDHEVFHTFFDIDSIKQIPNVRNGCNGGRTWEQADDIYPAILGMNDDSGRLMMVVTYNSDLGDAWEHMDVPCYPEMYSSWSYRMTFNFMMYAMSH